MCSCGLKRVISAETANKLNILCVNVTILNFSRKKCLEQKCAGMQGIMCLVQDLLRAILALYEARNTGAETRKFPLTLILG